MSHHLWAHDELSGPAVEASPEEFKPPKEIQKKHDFTSTFAPAYSAR